MLIRKNYSYNFIFYNYFLYFKIQTNYLIYFFFKDSTNLTPKTPINIKFIPNITK